MKLGTKSSPWEKIKSTPWWKILSPKPLFSHPRIGLPITVPAKRSYEDEQRQLSWAISKRNSTPKPVPMASSSSGPCASNAVIPHMMSSQAQNLINSFTNCNVTFNLNNKASPDKPRKQRFHFIESDSDTDWTISWTVLPDFKLFAP